MCLNKMSFSVMRVETYFFGSTLLKYALVTSKHNLFDVFPQKKLLLSKPLIAICAHISMAFIKHELFLILDWLIM